jgi:hypothetical protein
LTGSETLKINRVPVLTLWAAVVAERLGFDHDEALTLGRAVTIGNLSRSGELLEIGCIDCSRIVYVEAQSLRVADSQPVPSLARRLKCSRCGARNGLIHNPIAADNRH